MPSNICLFILLLEFLVIDLRMASPLPLAASTNSELNLKAIFRLGRFRDAPNNQRMASAFPCADPISTGT